MLTPNNIVTIIYIMDVIYKSMRSLKPILEDMENDKELISKLSNRPIRCQRAS